MATGDRRMRTRTMQGRASSVSLALILAAGLALVATSASAHDPTADAPPKGAAAGQGDLADIGAKLSDPTANIWALSFNI